MSRAGLVDHATPVAGYAYDSVTGEAAANRHSEQALPLRPLRQELRDFGSLAPDIAFFSHGAPKAVSLSSALSCLGATLDYLTHPSELAGAVKRRQCDIALLEIFSDDPEAMAWCASIRQAFGTAVPPLVVLSDGLDEDRRLRAYADGADLVLEMPIAINELVVRIQGMLRRSHAQNVGVRFDSDLVSVNVSQRKVSCCGNEIFLHSIEWRLLSFLMKRPDRPFSREEIVRGISEGSDTHLRTIDVYIRRLRKALGCTDRDGPIRTVTGVGYSLETSTVSDGKGRGR